MFKLVKILIVLQIVIISLNAQTNYELFRIPLSNDMIDNGIKIGDKLYFKTVYIETYPQLKPFFYLDSYNFSTKSTKREIINSFSNKDNENLRFYKFYDFYDSLLIYRSQDLFILNHDNKKNYINFDYDSTKIVSSHYNSITEDDNKKYLYFKIR